MVFSEIMNSKDMTILYLRHFIQSLGLTHPHSGIYIGITDDPDRRAKEHGVDINSSNWKCYKCSSVKIAREIEAELLEVTQALGDKGGGNENTVYVYVFIKI